MNVKFEYLYRDAGNFKSWGEVVFANPNGLAIDVIGSMAEKALIDETFFPDILHFDASKAGVPDRRFDKYIPDLDHDWHEVSAFMLTDDPPNDPQRRKVEEFIESLQQASCALKF